MRKKAIAILSVVALGAVSSGTYAYKAKNMESIVFVHDPFAPPTLCTVPLAGVTTSTNPNPIQLLATTTTTLPCVGKTFYITD